MRKIYVSEYDPNWVLTYEASRDELNNLLTDILDSIHHIGSTAVPGLLAKPTIDILVLVNDIETIDGFNEDMENLGYIAMGEAGIPGRRYFYKTLEDNEFIETHHVHIYQVGNAKYQEELLFRDYLRIDDSCKEAYGTLKKKLAQVHRDSPPRYTIAKSDFIKSVIQKAKTYFDK